MKIKSLLLLLLFCFIIVISASAQEADTTKVPKIGLVLSGGAAKGIAHIGVLRVLEEIGITPDYITGTSMGAVVGGLYALGYSASEISELNAKADWGKLLSDKIPLNQVVFEEKEEYNRYIFGIPIRNYEFKLPSGVIEGQQLGKFFSEQMWPMTYTENYDSLPIPFHCMAVDLISGKMVEFKSGNLTESVRASMSIPSLFSPESIDTALFVDGGVLRNFPVSEVLEMGADIVIGVYVGFDEHVTKEDLFSLSDVLSRATVFVGIEDSKTQMHLVDLLIQPDLKGLGASDFAKSKEIDILGEVSALEMQKILYKLADSLNLKKREIKKIHQPDKIFIQEIKVKNDRPFVSDNFIKIRSKIKEKTWVSKEDLSNAVDQIFGTQYFKKVTYTLEKIDDTSYRLFFNVKESTRAFLNVAIHYDNQYGPGVTTNLTLRNYLAPASRATVSLNIAENPGLRIDVNKYLGKYERIMDNFFLNWNQNKNSLYDQGVDIGTYSFSNLTTGVGGKYSFTINQQVGGLAYYEINKIYPHENLQNYYNVPSFDSYGYSGFAYKLFYNLNTTDDNFFPTRGVRFDMCYAYNFEPKLSFDVNSADKTVLREVSYFSEDMTDFYRGQLHVEMFATIFKKLTLNVGGSIGISSDETAILNNYILGGFDNRSRLANVVPFAGMNNSEAIVPNYGLIKVGFDIEIVPRIYMSARTNIGFYTASKNDMIDIIKNSPLEYYLKGYSIGLRANTVIGPVNLMYSDNDFDGKNRWYVSIGYPF